jgi:hypothetical protein
MVEPVNTRIIEICEGEWVVQFEGGLNSWTTFSDTFSTKEEAEEFNIEQISQADLGGEE